MATLMLDTHVVAWLYAGKIEKFPARAQARIDADFLAVSPMVTLELQYLHEIGRLRATGDAVVDDLRKRVGLRVSDTSLDRVIAAAFSLSWTRDPFDRIIAAHCLVEQTPLLTADGAIREHLPLALWD